MASSKHHLIVCPSIAIILILGYCAPGLAVEFAGGTGEPNHPYQIATAEQLIAISSDPSLYDKHFLLTADIDLDPNLPGRKVFQGPVIEWPVPRTETGQGGLLYVYGSFDGGGHVIRNGVIFGTGSGPYSGFFGRIAQEAVVRAVHLEDMIVVEQTNFGSSYYQGLLASVNYGTVLDCSATGTVVGYQVGGLIGRNAGIVTECHADCDVYGSTVGGLIAVNDVTARVVLCESDSFTYGSGLAGGLVATNKGTVQFCTAGGYVSGAQAGGLVGQNIGWTRESFATATISGSQYAGGLACNNTGTVVNCYATGLISGASPDGLVANNSGTLLSSYSTTASQIKAPPRRLRSVVLDAQSSGRELDSGEPAASSDVTISSYAQGTIRYVYYLDPNKPEGLTGSPSAGYGIPLSPAEMKQASSFVGFDFYSDANSGPAGPWFMPPDGYPVLTWQTQITGLAGVPDVAGLSPEQAALLLEAAGFEPNGVRYDYARIERVSSGATAVEVGAKGQVIATQPSSGLLLGSPVTLVVSLGKYDFKQNPGDGSEANPYQIAMAGQLDGLYGQTIPAGRHYILAADIDMSAHLYPSTFIRDFSGEFNGNGHTIRGLQLETASLPYSDSYGLFGTVESSGSVHDLTVDAARLDAADKAVAGILVGQNLGQVIRCKAAGQVLGGRYVIGGLVGGNGGSGQLTDCCFSGRVQPIGEVDQVGGLVGSNIGAIVRCCARDVEVSATRYIGGLVGENARETGIIEACYATGTVQGVDSVGGLVGRNGIPSGKRLRSILTQAEVAISADPVANGMVRDCYAACLVTGQQRTGGCIGLASVPEAVQESCFFLAPKDGGGPDNGLGRPLTASQMKQQASFTAWDFESVWTICEGKDYPRLRWDGIECDQ